MEDFGPRVRRVRLQRQLSQSDLATLSVLNVKHVSDLEQGRYKKAVRVETVKKLARALGVDPVWLQFGIVEQFPEPREDT